MSRSGYSEDDGDGGLNCWRGAVSSAIRGKRGQGLFREMLAAFDAMPSKRLIAEELAVKDGDVCALGAVAVKRGLDVSDLDPEDHEGVAGTFGIAHALACEVMWYNDEGGWNSGSETPEERFVRMRRWVAAQIKWAPGDVERRGVPRRVAILPIDHYQMRRGAADRRKQQ